MFELINFRGCHKEKKDKDEENRLIFGKLPKEEYTPKIKEAKDERESR